ncbi:MAG TPA: YggS family pyridoxal phosphate-dependent enzyme [Spirochaetota bacterium]|nr:YggS family pyridoxal phosphate-dependent enzyme [Spirochaetota bacterium]HOM39148.1 YggS family pyridoxal phosphate-dependent enzyme [Spirochaetota bacterium]HPQ48325.1 YggS family pyridoxal phosphate-dependent enzyme [Spirochaetota bacterium]
MNLEFIGENLKRLRENIENIKAKNNIKREIKLVAVSKTFPIEYIIEAYNNGQRYFGENRVQEAENKIITLKDKDIEWHLVGTLQKNKVNKAAPLFSLIHSVDSFELADKISKKALEIGKKMEVLIQINTSGEKTKSGFCMEYSIIEENVGKMLELKNIEIKGVMTIGPLTEEENLIRKSFKSLREIRDKLESKIKIKLPEISMGMSSDYRIAIEEGSTILRIGSLIFGKRE